MGTEEIMAKPASRRGMAMFIVLGAIILVTLFGYVGLTLAGRDQTLSGDLNDIKSRDEAAIASLQFGINRLLSDPVKLVAILNTFINSGRANGGKPVSTWLAFGVSTNTLTLEKKEPDWFSLTSDATNKSAMKLQILGVGAGDSTLPVNDLKDSAGVYISLRGLARGRHGDEKEVLAAYRIHGITVDYAQDTLYYTIPRHSFYIGGTYKSANMKLGTDGDVYIAGAGESFLNAGSGMVIKGDLKWNGNLKVNGDPLGASDVVVNGNAFVNGYLYSNGGRLVVKGNLGIANGFDEMNGPGVAVQGNLWVGGVGVANNWNSTTGGVSVGGNFVFEPSNMKTPHNLVVGGSAWLLRASTFSIVDSFKIGSHLFLGDNATNQIHSIVGNGDVTKLNLFRIDSSVVFSGGGSLTLPKGSVGDTLQVNQQLTISGGGALTVTKVAQVDVLVSGTLTGTRTARGGVTNWRTAPTPKQLGLPDSLRNTTPVANPMDSVKVDDKHSPTVNSFMQPLTKALFQSAGVTANPDEITPFNLNKLYTYMKGQNTLLNGYMVLRIDSLSDIGDNFSDNVDTGFKGKMLIVIEKKMNANGHWPHSQGRENIQVIVVRKSGALNNFGWDYGNFSGLFYWENPCGSYNMKFQTSTMYGAVLMGTTLTAPGYGYTTVCSTGPSEVTPNSTPALTIIRDQGVFLDIGKNLPGVLAPARDGVNKPISLQGTTYAWRRNPLMTLRLVHTQPYFEPIGVFR